MTYLEDIMPTEEGFFCPEGQSPNCVRGRITGAVTNGPAKLSYFIYRPRSSVGNEPVVFSIHGYTRNALEHIVVLQELAEERGVTVVVPHFTRQEYRRYQQVCAYRDGTNPQSAFIELVDELQSVEGLDLSVIRAVGYSGGGQFLHRLVMLSPDTIDRMVLFAPGWYTMPSTRYPFPLGLGPSEILSDHKLSLTGYQKTDVLVLVGDKDTNRSETLNTDNKIDQLEGRNRVERAQNWTKSMNAFLPVSHQIKLQLLCGLRHGFRRNFQKKGYGRLVLDYLLEDKATQSSQDET